MRDFSPASSTPKEVTARQFCESPTPTRRSSAGLNVRCAMFNFRFVVEHIARSTVASRSMSCASSAASPNTCASFTPLIPRSRASGTSPARPSRATRASRSSRIEPLGKAMRLYDITTGTEDFIANGVVSHNCYARPSHAYVGLSPGLDFETKLFYKADAAQTARSRARRAKLQMLAHHARRQHRSLPAARKNTQGHALHPRSARALQAPGHASPPRARWSRATSTCSRNSRATASCA